MDHDDHNASPFNAMPPVVWAFAGAILAIELLFQGAERGLIGGPGGIGWRVDAITSFGFFDSIFGWMIETGNMPPEHLLRFVSYLFVHGSFTHAAFAIVMALAIGKMVAEAFSSLGFLMITLLSSIAGALAYGIFLSDKQPLFGAFPAIYGLIGALTYMLWVRAKVEGTNQLNAFAMISVLMGIQLVFKLLFGGGNDWVADIAGFAMGFGISLAIAPGHAVAALNRIRRR